MSTHPTNGQSVPSQTTRKDFLTASEFEELLKATDRSRHSARDRAMLLMLYWHGMRASELCDVRVVDLDLKASRVFFARAKGSRDAHHPLRGDVLRAVNATYANDLTRTYRG